MTATPDSAPGPMAEGSDQDVGDVLRRNIDALRHEREREEAEATFQQRLADRVTRFSGSMVFVYIHIVLVGGWVAANLPEAPAVLRFDPTFVVLAMAASVEAIFLSTFILISQNRQAASAKRRADLALQMGLLAEHEITRLMRVVTAMGRRLGVEEAQDPSLEPLKRDVAPEKVLQQLDGK